ncbi:Sec-independent protein translocase subunit TatA [Streptacidiphilus sp. 4-A2]|nr:Sec-independent protein translocase subunit TatA [Streptacidiphilus sp. 4-A2]
MFENRALEILIVALVVLLLFGAKRLPDAARSLGKSLRILKAETQALRTDTAAATEPDSSSSSPVLGPVQPALFETASPAAPSHVSEAATVRPAPPL